MNIKGFITNILPNNEIRSVDAIGKTIKSDQTNDRDANGQQSYGEHQHGNQKHKEPMTDEQLKKAMNQLRNLAAVKEHKWTIHLEKNDDKRFVIVKDNLGNVIRRIPEIELWSLPAESSPTGQLIKRSA